MIACMEVQAMKRSPKNKRPDSTRKIHGKVKRKKRKLSYFRKMILIIGGIILSAVIAAEIFIFSPIKNPHKHNKIEDPKNQTEAESRKDLEPEVDITDMDNLPEQVLSDVGPLNVCILDVPALCQNPELPTGCESCCATMALNYIGVQTDMATVASLIPRQEIESREGRLFGPNPEELFVGSPFESFHCFGCFENVMIDAVNSYFDGVCAQKVYGSLEDFCTEFIDRNQTVMIWATMNMRAISYTSHWTLPDGNEYYWPGGEHCLLLIGYDEYYYYLNDPMEGAMVAYPKEVVQSVYEEMGSRAMVIY